MWYNVNFKNLVILLLPTFLRKQKTVAYLRALVKPIATIHNKWLQKRIEDWYKLENTGQVCYLRFVLNDKLDFENRRIYIDEGNSFPRKYIYTRSENRPVFLGTNYIYQKAEFIGTGADFIVYVPLEILNSKLFELHDLIQFYKLASKRYQIVAI